MCTCASEALHVEGCPRAAEIEWLRVSRAMKFYSESVEDRVNTREHCMAIAEHSLELISLAFEIETEIESTYDDLQSDPDHAYALRDRLSELREMYTATSILILASCRDLAIAADAFEAAHVKAIPYAGEA